MKIFFGTIFTLIFIGLACFAGYFAYDLYFNDHTQSDSQSSKDVQQSQEESYQNNDANTQTQQIDEQAAKPNESDISVEQPEETQNIKHGMSDIQYIQGQYEGLIQHMKERASQGADADELHELQKQLDEYAIQHANELNLDQGWNK
ncbi:hypothetical protein [Staphylococcus gallinarum]|uniref:Uncharacterized protein n=1 Tax=Staphylococcus gallinarum TaxID=1293 RepID=A0A3A0T752_STAGA|nr:hypothetical protein [Staphylococcus gallinarum]PTL09955.1 hypothetical protein BUZ09_04755 [Staphylococcus gallinarum]RIL22032.1 hypothetical protein BUY97_11415 [Staphylococcus gallinarum]RIL29676.1 hypothetical protein BUY98_12905 [Staphylococcus gallinarum]RIL30386.1 hypothetical protein BUY95_02440 [Staphylococcus gallinarum]RIO74059.1 hypothetical protein BUZ12_13320 [Staphylococcus gallinarum]